MARYFHAGDPGLPDEGIIIGHGGGFTLQYSNLILLGTGRARFMTYITDYEGRIPQDYESATILHNDYNGEFREYVRQLERMSFWNMSMREPQSTEIEYVVAISPAHGLNAVKWAAGDPAEIAPELYRLFGGLARFLTDSFSKEHGPG